MRFGEVLVERMLRTACPVRGFRAQALHATVDGKGSIIHIADGSIVPFIMTGRTDPTLLEQIGRRVFGLAWLKPKFAGVVTHNATLRNTLADAVVDAIDVSAPGLLRIETSGAAEIAVLPFSNPAYGAASGGTAASNAITSDTTATAGTIAQFETRDGAATSVFLGACSTSGEDLNFSSLTVATNDTVSCSQLDYSAPA